MEHELIEAMESLDEKKVLAIVGILHKDGESNKNIINALNKGMLQVGKLFENRSYYLADLIVSGVIYKKALDILGLSGTAAEQLETGKIIIGVVKNDIHDIGKDIIVSTLRTDGFDVIDLGTDVDIEDFIKSVAENKPDILALSGTMSFAVDEMEQITEKLIDLGMRDEITVIAGGVGVNENNVKRAGADYYSEGPLDVLELCRRLIKN